MWWPQLNPKCASMRMCPLGLEANPNPRIHHRPAAPPAPAPTRLRQGLQVERDVGEDDGLRLGVAPRDALGKLIDGVALRQEWVGRELMCVHACACVYTCARLCAYFSV